MGAEVEVTPGVEAGITAAVETVMGDNPYFPAEAQESSPEQSSEEQVGDPASQEGEQASDQAQDDPEPTFDIETDRAAGINVDSPEYKHFQGHYTRATQALKKSPEKPERDLGSEIDALKALVCESNPQAAPCVEP